MIFQQEQFLQRDFHNLSELEVDTIRQQLPDKKYYEFLYHAWFNNRLSDVEKFYKDWVPSDEWTYPVDDCVRFRTLLLDNEQFIRDKRVLEIGSHLGYIPLFCMHMGAKFVTGLEPRTNKQELSKFICQQAGFTNFEFTSGSTHDSDFVTGNPDTVILSALIYHVADHYTVLKKISTSGASCLIIENREREHIKHSATPDIDWRIENLEPNSDNGWHYNYEKFLTGTPNQAWIDCALTEMGWRKHSVQEFCMKTHTENIKQMTTSVWIR